MADVDAILAGKYYTDRKGREWRRSAIAPWWFVRLGGDGFDGIWVDKMRLKIIRELHRDECPGLVRCVVHPVPVVIAGEREKWRRRKWKVRTAGTPRVAVFDSFGAAVDAARHMTGGTP